MDVERYCSWSLGRKRGQCASGNPNIRRASLRARARTLVKNDYWQNSDTGNDISFASMRVCGSVCVYVWERKVENEMNLSVRARATSFQSKKLSDFPRHGQCEGRENSDAGICFV